VFAFPARGAADIRAQKEVFDDAEKATGGRLVLAPARQVALVARWPAIGEGAAAATLLLGLAAKVPTTPELPSALLGLARDLRVRGDTARANSVLGFITATWPASGEAAKARVLLTDVG
jgi:hypothetical protein